MKILTEGHSYQLDNHEQRGEPQTLHFIHKELRVLIDRLNFFYTKMPSRETERALGHLSAALHELEARTARRVAAKVEGTNEVAPDEMPSEPQNRPAEANPGS